MKTARIWIVIGFFLTVSVVVTYRIVTTERPSEAIRAAKEALEREKIELERYRIGELESEKLKIQRERLRRNADLIFYGIISSLSAFWLAVLIAASGYHRARVRQASVWIAHIGEHSKIPIHQKDLQSFYPIAVNLSLAEIEASASSANERAYKISRQMIHDISEYTRAIAGKRGLPGAQHLLPEDQRLAFPIGPTPTFAELLTNGDIAPGKPLICGYEYGQPQYRKLPVFKSMAIAGHQGSGKTRSTGFLIACAALACDARVYVCDPHANHDDGLSALIRPLARTPLVTIINPFDLPPLVKTLERILNRRLNGTESSEQPILFVIDELARIAKLDIFDEILGFIERCTEETRKANITFFGGSPKWTARHFKGRADIRGCMNSMLIHKTKPSQAELLLEDSQDKKLVKHLKQPGDAILVTDYGDPHIVSMPYCERNDMHIVADIIGKNRSVLAVREQASRQFSAQVASTDASASHHDTERGVLVIDECQEETDEPDEESADGHPFTSKFLNQYLTPSGPWGQRELERRTSVNQSKISKFRNRRLNKDGSEALSRAEKDVLYDFLTSEQPDDTQQEPLEEENESEYPILTLPECQTIH